MIVRIVGVAACMTLAVVVAVPDLLSTYRYWLVWALFAWGVYLLETTGDTR